jgi:hypothetical protein
MKDVYLQVYRETFTQEEITSIIAFYAPRRGKRWSRKCTVAMQKAGTLYAVSSRPDIAKGPGHG